jgi:hypothetical protein
MAVHAFCHTIWWAIIGFAVVLAVTEATKPWASRYRPDYMSRCKPNVAEGKPLGFFQRTDCAPDVKGSDFVKDGRCACVLRLCLAQEKRWYESEVQLHACACSCRWHDVAHCGLCACWECKPVIECPASVLKLQLFYVLQKVLPLWSLFQLNESLLVSYMCKQQAACQHKQHAGRPPKLLRTWQPSTASGMQQRTACAIDILGLW